MLLLLLYSYDKTTELRLSTEHHGGQYHRSGLGVSQPKPFVYTLSDETHLLFSRKERWIFNNHGSVLDMVTECSIDICYSKQAAMLRITHVLLVGGGRMWRTVEIVMLCIPHGTYTVGC